MDDERYSCYTQFVYVKKGDNQGEARNTSKKFKYNFYESKVTTEKNFYSRLEEPFTNDEVNCYLCYRRFGINDCRDWKPN